MDGQRSAPGLTGAQRPVSRAAWVGVAAATAAVIILAVLAHGAAYFPMDMTVTKALQMLQSPGLDAAALGVDWLGYVPQIVVISATIALGLWLLRRRWESVVSVMATALEGAVDGTLKLLVRRPRPDVVGIKIYQPLGDFTFPSGHVFSYLMVFGLLAYFCYALLPRTWWRGMAVAVLVGLVAVVGPVRIYLGEHWLSDVAAGYLLGGLGLFAMIRLYGWGRIKLAARAEAHRRAATRRRSGRFRPTRPRSAGNPPFQRRRSPDQRSRISSPGRWRPAIPRVPTSA